MMSEAAPRSIYFHREEEATSSNGGITAITTSRWNRKLVSKRDPNPSLDLDPIGLVLSASTKSGTICVTHNCHC